MRRFLVLLLALGAAVLSSSCATTVALKNTDPASTALVFGKVEGWIIGPQALGRYAGTGTMSLRCDGFFLYDRVKDRRYPIDLSSSGYFELTVPGGEYLLKRSQKDMDGREESTSRFGCFTARTGALHDLGEMGTSLTI
jgi:hypothetical protein